MIDQEIKNWAISEFDRSCNIPDKAEAKQIRHRAKTIFDKRFPNPDVCLCCNQKIHGEL